MGRSCIRVRETAYVWSTEVHHRGTQKMAYVAHCHSFRAGGPNVTVSYDVDHVLAIIKISALRLYIADHFLSKSSASFSHISPLEMPAPTSAIRNRTQSTNSTDSPDKAQTSPSVSSGTYDDTVIPPSHDVRTIVLCFDGTGDQFDGDVCAYSRSYGLPH